MLAEMKAVVLKNRQRGKEGERVSTNEHTVYKAEVLLHKLAKRIIRVYQDGESLF